LRNKLIFLSQSKTPNIFKSSDIVITQNNYETTANQIESTKFPFSFLRPFNEPVPNDWLCIEENFVLFLIMNLPILTNDFFATPEAQPDDHALHMIFIREGISKLQLINLFTDTVSGIHMASPFVEYIRIKAFRIEPLPVKPGDDLIGNFMIDGERIPYGPIQGELMPSLASAFSMDSC